MNATLLCLAVLVAATGVAVGLGNLPLGRRPGLVLAVGSAAAVTGLVALVASVAAMLVPTPTWQRDGCTGCEAVLTFVGCVGVASGLGCALAAVLACAERASRRNAAARLRMRMALADPRTVRCTVGRREVHLVVGLRSGAATLRLDGRSVITVDRSLAARLSETELAAVVEHEAAHLDLWHDRVRWAVQVLTGALAWAPGMARVGGRVHLLCEAAADDRAARRIGSAAVRSALMSATAPTCAAFARRAV